MVEQIFSRLYFGWQEDFLRNFEAERRGPAIAILNSIADSPNLRNGKEEKEELIALIEGYQAITRAKNVYSERLKR
jgi:hypothetical protein